jgi:hypothetical protein
MTRSPLLAVAAVVIGALAVTPVSAKPLKRGHHQYHARVHHHSAAPAALRAFGAVRAPGYFNFNRNSPAATGGGSLGYNRGIYAN